MDEDSTLVTAPLDLDLSGVVFAGRARPVVLTDLQRAQRAESVPPPSPTMALVRRSATSVAGQVAVVLTLSLVAMLIAAVLLALASR